MLGEEGRWMSFVSRTLKINVNDAQNKEVYSKKKSCNIFCCGILTENSNKARLGETNLIFERLKPPASRLLLEVPDFSVFNFPSARRGRCS